MAEAKMYKLMGPDGNFYLSPEKGMLGGNGKLKIYGRMDCPSALSAIKDLATLTRHTAFSLRMKQMPSQPAFIPAATA